MKRLDLKAQIRSKTGKGSARSARRTGLLPAVMYGGGTEPVHLQVDRHTVEVAMQAGESENLLVNLEVDGGQGQILTLVRQTQHNPLSGDLEHLDFLRVSEDKTITTTVALHTTGSPVGVRTGGGVFEQVLRELEIECLPQNIPDEVVVNISELGLNESLHVSDIPPSDAYTILTSPERTIANVTAPSTTAAMETEAAEEGTEGETAKADKEE